MQKLLTGTVLLVAYSQAVRLSTDSDSMLLPPPEVCYKRGFNHPKCKAKLAARKASGKTGGLVIPSGFEPASLDKTNDATEGSQTSQG